MQAVTDFTTLGGGDVTLWGGGAGGHALWVGVDYERQRRACRAPHGHQAMAELVKPVIPLNKPHVAELKRVVAEN